MTHPQLNLSCDELLSTTRAVRKRLDFDKPVPMGLIDECLQLAMQAPTGSYSQGWHFIIIDDKEKISSIAQLYSKAFNDYLSSAATQQTSPSEQADSNKTLKRVITSAQYLAANLQKTPVMLIPCIEGRADAPGLSAGDQAGIFGSILPATWSFMLAARARGLGTCWTTLHLTYEKEVAEILNIPFERIEQVALIPVAYTIGTEFKSAPRKPIDEMVHVNSW
ncbi:MAG: nitroreductase [Planctomycetota bacterium]|jgi:nitroreductase